MLHSLHIPTLCSFSRIKSYNSRSHSPHPPPPPTIFLRFRTSHRENLRYLKALGIVQSETKYHKSPSPEAVDQILSTVSFFKSKGFADSDFARLSFMCPNIFSSNFDNTDIEPVFDFLTIDLPASVQESRGLIIRCPNILLSDVEYCLRPTLDYLRKLGVQKLNAPTNLNAHLLNTRVEKLQTKMNFLRSIGFSYEESARVCARLPAIFGYSIENNLRPKVDYLVEEMRRSMEELKEFPQYFAFSLEKRIAPRHLHLKQRNSRVPLKRMLLWSDQRFYAKWK